MQRKTIVLGALGVLVAGALGLGAVQLARGVGVYQGYAPEQPIAYSHKLHAGKFEIPCQYCHFAASRSRHAGIPPLSVCMNCHDVLDKQTVELAKLKEAVAHDRPIRWVKVHNLPDFVYFSHRQHVGGGVECQTCHGPVETMERVRQHAPLTMGWCIECHRDRGITEFSEQPVEAAHDGGAEALGIDPDRPLPRGGADCAKCHY